ncbi:MAG: NADPH-dependent glutamate synthase [Elusimicrobiota bacterium]|jgi:glutamate synthase (NADPH/NADH) small chain|nr:NADPH-dependent glutamate synthase [Elusimicrobiota bacterium]
MPNPSLPRRHGKRQSPRERIKNFDEVSQGLSKEEALLEADRCLNCKNPKCEAACPVNVKIPAFIELLLKDDLKGAASKIMETSLLPAVCGRVCPQENYCQGACVLKEKFGPVSIGLLERYVASAARKAGLLTPPKPSHETGLKIACIGSGPSSLSCAAELRRAGHAVVIFEALHDYGGVLRYGIPSFRLPRAVITAEVETVKEMGVKFINDTLAGPSLGIEELLKEYDAVYIGSGAGLPTMADIAGENALGVYSANEFLTRVNLMEAYNFPRAATPVRVGKNVIVLGGGNSAMDAARCAARLGPQSVRVVYRRSRNEMPAREEEVENAIEEGVIFDFLTIQKEILTDENGRVKGLKCLKARLGEPDEKGRRKPVIMEGSDFIIPADTIIVAIGQKPNPVIPRSTPALKMTEHGTIAQDENGATSIAGVFCGGDIARGGATVLLAMKDGIASAHRINKYLHGKSKKGK